MNEVYERIDELCAARGINITEMCKQSGAARGSLSDLKQGRIKNLSPDTLAKIAAELDTTVDYLLGRGAEGFEFYENYVRLCNSVQKSPSAVAQEIGFRKSSVTRWKSGTMPTDASLQAIADYFGVPAASLRGNSAPHRPMERMQELRKEAGLTLKQLGEAANKAESTISQYESGKREPDNETLIRIADILGCSVDYLLGRKDTKTPTSGGRRGEGTDPDISEADVRAWLQAHGDELSPGELAQLFGPGSAEAALLAMCQLLPDTLKVALVEIARSLARSQGLLE